jgi:CheY-like chemotaxis protein
MPTAGKGTGLGLATVPSTLLLVDDEAPLRCALAEILRDSAYIVLEAPGSQEALTIARDYPGAIELLVTDVVMPGLRGPGLHQRLQAFQKCIQVLFMSGYAEGLAGHSASSRGVIPSGALPLRLAAGSTAYAAVSQLRVLVRLAASFCRIDLCPAAMK